MDVVRTNFVRVSFNIYPLSLLLNSLPLYYNTLCDKLLLERSNGNLKKISYEEVLNRTK